MSSNIKSKEYQSEIITENVSFYRWVILVACFMAFFVQFIDQLAWVPLIPISKNLFGFTMTQAGAFMTSYAIGALVAQLPGGILADKLGAKGVMITSLLSLGVFSFSMGLMTTFTAGLILRFLTGLSGGAVYASGVKLIFSWFPRKERATAMGFFLMGTTAAITITNGVIPVLIEKLTWRSSFFAAGILSAVLGLTYFIVLRESKYTSDETPDNASGFDLRSLKSLIQNRDLMLTIGAAFGALWATWGANTWAMSDLKGSGIPLVTAGAVMAGFGIAGLVSKPITGFISDRIGGKRKPIIVIDLILLAVMLLAFPLEAGRQTMWILGLLLGLAAFGYSSSLNTLIPELAHRRFAATAVALYIFITNIGSIVQPIIVGRVLDTVAKANSFLVAFSILAAGPILGILFIWKVSEQNKSKSHGSN